MEGRPALAGPNAPKVFRTLATLRHGCALLSERSIRGVTPHAQSYHCGPITRSPRSHSRRSDGSEKIDSRWRGSRRCNRSRGRRACGRCRRWCRGRICRLALPWSPARPQTLRPQALGRPQLRTIQQFLEDVGQAPGIPERELRTNRQTQDIARHRLGVWE